MAHAAKLSSLADDLTTSFTSLSKQSRAFKNVKEQALRGFRSQQYARTNQFDVQNSLNGLIEKFEVKGKDDLAEALRSRLQELGDLTIKWRPEILALFLELSDKPLGRSTVAALELLQPSEPEQKLTWEEIIAEDPLNEEGIWEDINYAVESSEDDTVYEDEASDATKVKQHDLGAEEERTSVNDSIFTQPNQELLHDIQKAQFWPSANRLKTSAKLTSEDSALRTITELQAIRETLFMLLGLPTSLFTQHKDALVIAPNGSYTISEARPATFHHTLAEIAEMGTIIWKLRIWIQQKQKVPLLQKFQSAIQKCLQSFSRSIAAIEENLLVPVSPITISWIQICDQIQLLAEPLVVLAQIVIRMPPQSPPFTCLELLFEDVCTAQLAEKMTIMNLVAQIFFDCLETYLSPVRLWMEQGELLASEDIFFIRSNEGIPGSGLWHERYSLRKTSDGNLYAPNFLQFASKKILNTGKSVVFLKEMGKPLQRTQPERPLDYETICGQQSRSMLAPFSELFITSFELWMQSKFSKASDHLRGTLEQDYGLSKNLEALQLLYFSGDGALLQMFADVVFEKIDQRKSWKDRFILTELTQSVYTQSACINADRITMRFVSTAGAKSQGIQGLSGFVLDYALPWPLLNIIRPSSFSIYQRIFELLLKVYRARYLTRQLLFRLPKTMEVNHTIFGIQHRLSWAIDIIQEHITSTVLAHETYNMRIRLKDAADVDDMAAICEKYMAKLLSQCLLSKNLAPIYQALLSMLDLCLHFADITREHFGPDRAKSSTAVPSRSKRRQSADTRFRRLRLSSNTDSDSEDDVKHGQEVEFASADGYDADSEIGENGSAVSFEEKTQQILESFERSCAFLVAGLRSVSRAGGEPSWEMLAERLDWRKQNGSLTTVLERLS